MFILVAGFFRLSKDIPKPVWRYPVSYIAFHPYAFQASNYAISRVLHLIFWVTFDLFASNFLMMIVHPTVSLSARLVNSG